MPRKEEKNPFLGWRFLFFFLDYVSFYWLKFDQGKVIVIRIAGGVDLPK